MATSYEQILLSINSIDGSAIDAIQRNELLLALRAAVRKVQTPWQKMQSLVWENSGYSAALKTVHDLGLFKNWPILENGAATFAELSEMTTSPCDEELLRRLLSALVFEGTLTSSATDRFGQTEFSSSLGTPSMAACLDYWFDVQTPALSHLPEFLQSTLYRLPTDPTSTAWNLATGTPHTFFQWLQDNPETMGNFALVMHQYASAQPAWTSLFPAETLLQGPDTGPVLVDVGGGRGHDLLKFVNKFRVPAGCCHLIDRPEVIELAKDALADCATLHGLDFFQDEIPVKGAQAYYLHSVLHDWNDDICRELLLKVKGCLAPHSKVLVHELVKLEDSTKDVASLGEFTVMAILGAPERTERQWRDLIHSAGLIVTKIYTSQLSTHSIIEAVIG